MSTRTVAADVIAVSRGAVVSLVTHFALLALCVFAAVDTAPDDHALTFWLLAVFTALGAVATLIIWRAARVPREAGRSLLGVAVGLLGVSVVFAVYAALHEGSAAVLLVAAVLIMIDLMLIAIARRVLAG